jgi:hypothetical protein
MHHAHPNPNVIFLHPISVEATMDMIFLLAAWIPVAGVVLALCVGPGEYDPGVTQNPN